MAAVANVVPTAGNGPDIRRADATLPVRVRRIAEEAPGIRSYELVGVDGGELPAFSAGAHVDVHIPGPGGFVRPYSIASAPWERGRYLLGVQREEAGRGGSIAMHERVREGDELIIGTPRNQFALVPDTGHSVLVAGGIGITPLLAMARELAAGGRSFELHVCTRSPERTPFRAALAELGDAVRLHHDGGDPARGLDVQALLDEQVGSDVYCCGPAGLMNAVRAATEAWPVGRVHFEAFQAAPLPAGGEAFEVRLRSSGACFTVPPDKTILQVLRENGVGVPSSCEMGNCGTCLTGLVEGEADHRDEILGPEERAANSMLLVCCSRAKSKVLVLDL